VTGDLKPALVESTLRDLIAGFVDYDIHKSLERDEETGEDEYPMLAALFIEMYENYTDMQTIVLSKETA